VAVGGTAVGGTAVGALVGAAVGAVVATGAAVGAAVQLARAAEPDTAAITFRNSSLDILFSLDISFLL